MNGTIKYTAESYYLDNLAREWSERYDLRPSEIKTEIRRFTEYLHRAYTKKEDSALVKLFKELGE